MTTRVGILILAGGEATRLPGKLLLPLADDHERAFAASNRSAAATPNTGTTPMIVRVYRNMRDDEAREIVISSKSTFPRAVDDALTAPIVIDRWPGRGPLAGMLSAMAQMRSRFVFTVAGDAPFLTAAGGDALVEHLRTGDEAIVPRHRTDGGIEPLAAIYDRIAFLREGLPVLQSGAGAIRRVIDRLNTRYVELDHRIANVNTQAEYDAIATPRITR